MADGFDLNQLGLTLQGISAGIGGQLPQFQQGLANQRQQQQVGARKRFINELGGAHSLIKGGNIIDAITLLSQSDDPNSRQIAVELQDPNQFETTMSELNSTVNIATSLGELEGPERAKQQIVDGQVVTLGETPTAVPIEGFTQRQKGRDTLSQVQSSQILPNGSTVQVFKDGSTRVTGPQGEVLTGQERQTAVEDAQEFGIDVQSRRAGGRTEATGAEKRASDLIVRGVAAAESTATIRRALTLLETVRTGGPQAISLAVKQRLGIEGANEGELSNSLGKAVLSQLRETFGAAFTESEGLRLERIEANFGKSPKTNRRLLQQALKLAERTSNRAIKTAQKRGRQAEAADIQDLLSFTLDIEQGSAGAILPPGLPVGTTDNGNGTFTLPTGEIVEPE